MKLFSSIIITIVGILAMAGTAFAEGGTLIQKYQSGAPIKVLIIPGHDNEFSGTEFRGMREADLNLRLAGEISEKLSKNPQLQVVVSRDLKTGNYIPELLSYFDTQKDAVASFTGERKVLYKKMKEEIAQQASTTSTTSGTVVPKKEVPHAPANAQVAYRLYAVNKWAGEHGFDLIISVHFNDHYPRKENKVGEYVGYSIYAPGDILPNAHPSREVAVSIGSRLSDIIPASNLFLESDLADKSGVIPDTSLIALGSNATLSIPSILIEYSYIYESQLRLEVSKTTLEAMAQATYLGLEEYLSGKKSESKTFTHAWTKNLSPGKTRNREVLAIQIALNFLKIKNCALDGIYGDCTKAGLRIFQKSHGLDADGLFGKKTRIKLNEALK